jgi:hypothetical protein
VSAGGTNAVLGPQQPDWIAGALSRSEYLDGLAAVGFVEAEVQFTQAAAEGMHAAIIRAVKPTQAPS